MTLRRCKPFWSRKRASINYNLSNESGWLHCYSLAKRFPAYSGDCIRIKRDSDNAELDIGFDGDLVDLASVNSFCAGTVGRVLRVYDQYGSGNYLVGVGAIPTIYQDGNSNYHIKTNRDSGFQFLSGFDVERNFCQIVNQINNGNLSISNRGSSNKGLAFSFALNFVRMTYFGVADYNSPLSNDGHISTSGLKYFCWYHELNTSFKSSSFVQGISNFKYLGSIAIGTYRSSTTPAGLAINYSVSGSIISYNSCDFRETFFFSEDKTQNTTIFDKKLKL